jgi:hypothetical protein
MGDDDEDEDAAFWEQFGEAGEGDVGLADNEDSIAPTHDPAVEARYSREELRMELVDESSSGVPILPVLAGIGVIVAAILWKRNSGSGPNSTVDKGPQSMGKGEVRLCMM